MARDLASNGRDLTSNGRFSFNGSSVFCPAIFFFWSAQIEQVSRIYSSADRNWIWESISICHTLGSDESKAQNTSRRSGNSLLKLGHAQIFPGSTMFTEGPLFCVLLLRWLAGVYAYCRLLGHVTCTTILQYLEIHNFTK